MLTWQGFIIGLISGILATLIAGNAHIRFHFEKILRSLLGKSSISIRLVSFTNYCENGLFLIHCIELKNNLWLTTNIPRVYFLSRGTFAYDAHAYKPFVYFRSRGISDDRLDYKPAQLLNEYGNNIVPYSPDNPSLGLNISRSASVRVVVVCEPIDLNKRHEQTPMNHLKIVGQLYAAVANPMLKVSPGSWWDMSIISEDFGHIDRLHINIPEDLENKEPLGDSKVALEMSERPACLMDLQHVGYTWPLRFSVNNSEIVVKQKVVKGRYQKEFQVIKPKTKRYQNPIRVLRAWIHKRVIRSLFDRPGIRIQ